MLPGAQLHTPTLHSFENIREVVPRLCTVADHVCGYTLPAGAKVCVLPYAIHRDGRYWRQPDVFDPDHCSAAAMATMPRHAYIPWGMGPRACVARQISMLQIKIVLTVILQQYTFTCPQSYTVVPEVGFPLGPAGAVQMTPMQR